jgi:glycosyltransferase involved in cell wall biosynthesis
MGVDGEAREIVAASGSGINMDPGNTDQLVEAVCRLADDSEFATTLAGRGRPFVSQHYTRDVLADRLLEIMQTVAAGKQVTDQGHSHV